MQEDAKMRKKYNYKALRLEFVTGDWPTVSKFCEAKGLKYGTVRRHSVGWREEKAQHLDAIAAETKERVKEAKILTAEEQARYVTGVMKVMLAQYNDLREEYKHLKEDLDAAREARRKADKQPTEDSLDKRVARVRTHMRRLEYAIPRVGEFVELTAGRATERAAQEGKATDEELDAMASELDEMLGPLEELAARHTKKGKKKSKKKGKGKA
jgi:hypothetical protein